MNDLAASGDPLVMEDVAVQNRRTAVRRWVAVPYAAVRAHWLTIIYSYAVVLLAAVSVQALCLFLLWRPPADWVSFFARFFTSPAIAGLFALGAAIIGARSLAKQLAHTKQKAADETWWQQFEWVTDRLIPADGSDSLLPRSLAFDLMNSLLSAGRAPFQRNAVEGILSNYLKEFVAKNNLSSGEEEASIPDGPRIDEAEARSLNNLVDALPPSSPLTGPARRVLEAYEYEREVLAALEHQGFKPTVPPQPSGPDAVITVGSEEIVLDVRTSLSPASQHRVVKQMRGIKESFGAKRGVIVTTPVETWIKPFPYGFASEGILIVEWEPSMGSFELKRQILEAVRGREE